MIPSSKIKLQLQNKHKANSTRRSGMATRHSKWVGRTRSRSERSSARRVWWLHHNLSPCRDNGRQSRRRLVVSLPTIGREFSSLVSRHRTGVSLVGLLLSLSLLLLPLAPSPSQLRLLKRYLSPSSALLLLPLHPPTIHPTQRANTTGSPTSMRPRHRSMLRRLLLLSQQESQTHCRHGTWNKRRTCC